ncbi:hypothetical protein DFH28DRAFT_1173966 [Melampsora americana]|nr:hypothetical protein DFH28DRAFT_1173966 [Melampsora americana]
MSFNSHIELEISLDLYLQQSPWNDLFDLAQFQSSSTSVQGEHPNFLSQESTPPVSQEYPLSSSSDSESQALHSNFLNHQNWKDFMTENASSTENWSTCLKQFVYNQSETFEKSLQDYNFDFESLGIEQPYCISTESNAQGGSLSTGQLRACSSITKRKRSDSSLSLGSSQSSTSYSTCKVFECFLDPKCSETFSRIEHLARHERRHTKAKPFKCHCGKVFSRLDNWRQHKNSLHKSSDVENAETEEILVQVQKGLQSSNKLRTPTMISVTKEGKGPEVKRVKRSGDPRAKAKPKSHRLSLSTLTARAPSQELPQLKLSGAELPHLALEGFGILASRNSAVPLDFSNNVINFTNDSFDGGPTKLDFTPQGTSSTLSDFSASPSLTPMNVNRVLSFHHEPSTLSPQFPILQPGVCYATSLLEPFQSVLNPFASVSLQPVLQPFIDHASLMMDYPTLNNPMITRGFQQSFEAFTYAGSNFVPLLHPQSFSEY